MIKIDGFGAIASLVILVVLLYAAYQMGKKGTIPGL